MFFQKYFWIQSTQNETERLNWILSLEYASYGPNTRSKLLAKVSKSISRKEKLVNLSASKPGSTDASTI